MAVLVLMALASLLKWLLVLVTIPLLVELLCLTVGAMLPVYGSNREENSRNSVSPLQRLTVIVPCHNEELTIARCIASLKAADLVPEVLVIAHNCTDATADVAANAGARVEVVNDLTRRGKGHALKHGFEFAFSKLSAEAVMIVDADSTVSPNITTEVLKRLRTSPVVQCRYQVKNYAASWRTTLTSLAFLGINVVRARGRDRLGLSSGIFGNGFAMRKEVLGNVEYDAHSIVEDMEFHLALVEHGYRVRFIREAVVLGDMPLSAKTAEKQHSRWEGGRIRLLKDWGMPLLRKILRGRLRLTEPLIDLLSLPLALEMSSLLLLLLFPSARLYVLAAFGVVLLHLGVVVHASPDRKGSVRTLLLAPAYLFWRVTTMASTVRASSKDAAWVRTERDTPEVPAHGILSTHGQGSQQIAGELMKKTPPSQDLPPLYMALLLAAVFAWPVAAAAQTVPAQAATTPATAPPAQDPGLQRHPIEIETSQPDPHEEYLLGAGDEISVSVAGRPELSGTHIVGPDGRITMPLLGSVEIGEKSRDDAAKSIDVVLANFYSGTVTSTVQVTKYGSNHILVLGPVEHAGVMNFDQPPSLLEAITRSGPVVNPDRSVQMPRKCVIYRGDDKVLNINISDRFDSKKALNNVRLRRNDILYFPETQESLISVMGEVTHPGPFRLTQASTLMSMLAEAGGITEKAGNPTIQILTPSTGRVQKITFKDLLKMQGGADVTLHDGDIVFVPRSGLSKVGFLFQQVAPIASVGTIFSLVAR